MWLITLIVTGAFLVWQKISGPTYEVKVKNEMVGGIKVHGELLRTHSINGDLPVVLNAGEAGKGNPGLRATVVWRRYPTDDPWERKAMVYEDGQFRTTLPAQPMAGKVEYEVEVQSDPDLRDPTYGPAPGGVEKRFFPPEDHGPAVARFKGDVPGIILVFHVTFMILGMLFSTGAGLEALTRGSQVLLLSRITSGCLLVGGLILGPIVQKYAFDAFWTGWPLGGDWTDNKLAVGALAWFIATILACRLRGTDDRGRTVYRPLARWAAVLAMVVILVIYSIPHSIHGSTFDYETGEHVQRM
jgi:hypothetical protein